MSSLWLVLALVVGVGWILYRRRLRVPRTDVTDAMVEQIESNGWIELDEPLDLEAAREEEERFWSDWEEAEPW